MSPRLAKLGPDRKPHGSPKLPELAGVEPEMSPRMANSSPEWKPSGGSKTPESGGDSQFLAIRWDVTPMLARHAWPVGSES